MYFQSPLVAVETSASITCVNLTFKAVVALGTGVISFEVVTNVTNCHLGPLPELKELLLADQSITVKPYPYLCVEIASCAHRKTLVSDWFRVKLPCGPGTASPLRIPPAVAFPSCAIAMPTITIWEGFGLLAGNLINAAEAGAQGLAESTERVQRGRGRTIASHR